MPIIDINGNNSIFNGNLLLLNGDSLFVRLSGVVVKNAGPAIILNGTDGVANSYFIAVTGLVSSSFGVDSNFNSVASDARIIVAREGVIRGNYQAISGDDTVGDKTALNIENDGYIIAGGSVDFGGTIQQTGDTNWYIQNRGTISSVYGDVIGITGSSGTHTITNSGLLTTQLGDYAIEVRGNEIGHEKVTNTGHISGSISLGAGDDSVNSLNGTMSSYVDLGSGTDSFSGGVSNDNVSGGLGNDTLVGGRGNDRLSGDAGSDRVNGGLGADYFYGSVDGAVDRFYYASVSESGAAATTRDKYENFDTTQDIFMIDPIDANSVLAGNQDFVWQSAVNAAFTGVRGQLHHRQVNPTGTANDRTFIEGDVNGDRVADFVIELIGLKAITANDFFQIA